MESLLYALPRQELQELAKEMKLRCSGNKSELCQRIMNALGKENTPSSSKSKRFTGSQRGGVKNISDEAYFLQDIPLNNMQKKYCRCILHVSNDQPEWCLREKAWYETRNGETCYNPYAVCTKSVDRSGPAFECVKHYDLDRIPQSELQSLAYLKNKSIDQVKRVAKKERQNS